MTWPNFEKLIYRLVALDGGQPEYVSAYGVPGDDQEGIDVYSRLSGGAGYVVYQCKRYRELYPYVIRNAVAEFLAHKWSRTGDRFASRFVFCTSHAVAGQSLADEIETQADLLRARAPSVVFEAWGQEELSKELKAHPDLVKDFFGPAFVDLFVPGGSARADEIAELTAKVAELTDMVQAMAEREAVIVSTLSWAPEFLKGVVERLADEHPEAWAVLRDVVGEPPDIDVVLANIAAPAMLLREAPGGTWKALALMAEEKGEWAPSSRAWQAAADREADDYDAAGDYVSAGASSHIGGDDERQAEMFELARQRHNRHPRLLIEEARDLEPQEQLDLLADVELREPVDVALVESQRALSYLLIPDLDKAREHAAEAEQPSRIASR